MSTDLVTIVSPSLLADPKSYWAMHFCSILETLREHKTLEYSFNRSIPAHLPKSVANLVSEGGEGFFWKIKGSIYNFGMQYFLCHYLMSFEGHSAVKKILEEVSNAYNYNLSDDNFSFGVFVCGIDSYSGEFFLKNTDAIIFGYGEQTINNVWEDIKYVDICILIEKNYEVGFGTKRIAILGEVEGNHGQRILRERFWNKKSSFCSFGVGVVSDGGGISTRTVRTDNGNFKVIVELGSEHSVVEDFKTAIDTFQVYFSVGRNIKIPLHAGMKESVELIRYYWHLPVDELIEALRSMIIQVDSALLGTNALSMPSIPKIIS